MMIIDYLLRTTVMNKWCRVKQSEPLPAPHVAATWQINNMISLPLSVYPERFITLAQSWTWVTFSWPNPIQNSNLLTQSNPIQSTKKLSCWPTPNPIHSRQSSCDITFLSASLYFSKRGAYWDRLHVSWRRWSLVGCHARALWPNGAS